MSAAVHTPPQQELQKKAVYWVDLAKGLQISDSYAYELAAEHLKTIKSLQAEVGNTFDPIIKAAHQTHQEAIAQKRRVNDPLLEAEAILKRGMGAFDQEQKRIASEDARRRQEEAEREAAVDREREIVDAETSGASKEEVRIITEAPLRVAPIVPTLAAPRVAGISSRENWKFEVTNKLMLDQFIAKNPQYAALTVPSNAAIGGIVRSLKGATNIPGIRVWNETNIGARRS